MTKRNIKGDISYYMEHAKYKKFIKCTPSYGGKSFVLPKARPIAYSTKATYEWLTYLKKQCKNWEELLSKVDGTSQEYIPDLEATNVVNSFIKHKSNYNEVIWS